MARTARLLIAHRGQLHLQRVDWQSWRDLAGTSGDFWDKHMGFFTWDGNPKPAWPAFTRITGGFAGGQIKTVGHEMPFAPSPPPGGGSSTKPPPQPPPNNCLLPGILC